MFYLVSDHGNSFGDLHYYGNEKILFIFEVCLFCLVDNFSKNLILAALITWIISFVSYVFIYKMFLFSNLKNQKFKVYEAVNIVWSYMTNKSKHGIV